MKTQLIQIWVPALLFALAVTTFRHLGSITGKDLFLHANEVLVTLPATAFALWCGITAIRPVLLYSACKKWLTRVTPEVQEMRGVNDTDDGVVVSLEAFRGARRK